MLSLLAFAAVGGWIYLNSNIYNTFRSPDQELDLQARYERDYRKYKDLPQPRIVAVSNWVDLHPETQSVVVDATWTVRNTHTAPIREVHLGMNSEDGDSTLVAVDLGGQSLVKHDAALGYRIYRLATPLQPGEQRTFSFRVDRHPHGLTVRQAQSEIVGNGSVFNSCMLPWFGLQRAAADRGPQRAPQARARRTHAHAPDGAAVWSGGSVLDPAKGKTYKAKITLSDSGKKLQMRGYIGIEALGRMQIWIRE